MPQTGFRLLEVGLAVFSRQEAAGAFDDLLAVVVRVVRLEVLFLDPVAQPAQTLDTWQQVSPRVSIAGHLQQDERHAAGQSTLRMPGNLRRLNLALDRRSRPRGSRRALELNLEACAKVATTGVRSAVGYQVFHTVHVQLVRIHALDAELVNIVQPAPETGFRDCSS